MILGKGQEIKTKELKGTAVLAEGLDIPEVISLILTDTTQFSS